MDHGRRQAHHNLLCLHMRVAIELVRAASSHEADALRADAGTQKCHGAAGARGVCRDLGGVDGGVGIYGEREAHAPSEIFRVNVAGRAAGSRAEIVDKGGRRGLERAEREDPGDQTQDGAKSGVAGTAVADGLVPNPILLSSKGEGDEGGGLEICDRAVIVPKGAGSHPKGEVFEAEQRVQGIIGHAEVLARPEEEKETDGEKGRGGERGERIGTVGEGDHLRQKRGWQRFYACRRRIDVGPSEVEGFEPEVQRAVCV